MLFLLRGRFSNTGVLCKQCSSLSSSAACGRFINKVQAILINLPLDDNNGSQRTQGVYLTERPGTRTMSLQRKTVAGNQKVKCWFSPCTLHFEARGPHWQVVSGMSVKAFYRISVNSSHTKSLLGQEQKSHIKVGSCSVIWVGRRRIQELSAPYVIITVIWLGYRYYRYIYICYWFQLSYQRQSYRCSLCRLWKVDLHKVDFQKVELRKVDFPKVRVWTLDSAYPLKSTFHTLQPVAS